MEICSSYRCALTQHQRTVALFRAKYNPHCSVLLCKTGSQQALRHCSYIYEVLLFIQVCSDQPPMHSSSVQGKTQSSMFNATLQHTSGHRPISSLPSFHTCNACMYMHLGNHSACSGVHKPHQETSCAPFGSCRASFGGRRAFRRIPVPARSHDGRFRGLGSLSNFSAEGLNQTNYPKLASKFRLNRVSCPGDNQTSLTGRCQTALGRSALKLCLLWCYAQLSAAPELGKRCVYTHHRVVVPGR